MIVMAQYCWGKKEFYYVFDWKFRKRYDIKIQAKIKSMRNINWVTLNTWIQVKVGICLGRRLLISFFFIYPRNVSFFSFLLVDHIKVLIKLPYFRYYNNVGQRKKPVI